MVAPINNRGIRDWLVQRVTAVLIAAYLIFIFSYLLSHQPLYFSEWHRLFHQTIVKVFTFIVFLSVVWHAWIGLWTVFTDYVKNSLLRLTLEVVVILLLLGYLSWGFEVLWATR